MRYGTVRMNEYLVFETVKCFCISELLYLFNSFVTAACKANKLDVSIFCATAIALVTI